MVGQTFARLGYPMYLVYPLAIAKALGIIAIISKKSAILKDWAYAGFFFDLVLAFFAHFMVGDGDFFPPVVGIVFLIVSRIYDHKVFGPKELN